MMSDYLFDPQVVRVAGWTLVHFLWQAGLIGLAVAAASRLLRHHEAVWRYGVASIGLVAMTLSALITATTLSYQQTTLVPFDVSVSWIESQLGWIYLAWCMGVIALSLKLAGGWWMDTQPAAVGWRPAAAASRARRQQVAASGRRPNVYNTL